MGAARDAFVVQFPEFTNTNVPLVEAMLAAALLEIDTDVWGLKATQGQWYLAAHKLALSPFGNNAKMIPTRKVGDGPHGETTYGTHYDTLARQVASGFRVA